MNLANTRPPVPPKGFRLGPNTHPPYQSGEVPLADQTVYPTSTNGRLFGKFGGNGPFSCSATVVSSPSQDVILTAGHCVLSGGSGYARKVVFVPAYHDGERPFGTWTATKEVASKQWGTDTNEKFDYGAFKLKSPSGTVGSVVGEEGIAYKQPRDQSFQVIGYPANHGKTELMWNCLTSFAGADTRNHSLGPASSAIGCDMTVGASGGGWTILDAQGVPYLNSVTTYGYDRLKNVDFGPYLTKEVMTVVNEANG